MLKTNLEGCFQKFIIYFRRIDKKIGVFETYETPHQIKTKKKEKNFGKKLKALKKKNTKKKN